jgi:hypothetical protein
VLQRRSAAVPSSDRGREVGGASGLLPAEVPVCADSCTRPLCWLPPCLLWRCGSEARELVPAVVSVSVQWCSPGVSRSVYNLTSVGARKKSRPSGLLQYFGDSTGTVIST